MKFQSALLNIDTRVEKERITEFISDYARSFKRDGAVVGLSGGIDSAVTAALCIEALGADRVLGLILPEKESNSISAEYAKKQADILGIGYEIVDITCVLEAFGTYVKRDQVVKAIYPQFHNRHKIKLSLPADLLQKDAYNFFTLTIMQGDDVVFNGRLSRDQLNGIVAATNTKQRTRMMHLFYCSEKHNFFVCGTTNRTEVIQGFFVKYGDGGVDVEPLAHLYKTQVYQLAGDMNIIPEIIERPPSPDTFSITVSDEEYYFRMPHNILDPLLYAWERNESVQRISKRLGLKEDQVKRAFLDFSAKYRATRHLRILPPGLSDFDKEDAR